MFGLRAWPTPVRILPNRVDPVHRAASKPQKIGRIEVDSSIQIRPVISSTHSLRIVLTIPQFARPLAPFIAATVITYLGVAKLQDMAVNSTSSFDLFSVLRSAMLSWGSVSGSRGSRSGSKYRTGGRGEQSAWNSTLKGEMAKCILKRTIKTCDHDIHSRF